MNHPNFRAENWRTIETIGCFRTRPVSDSVGTVPPTYIRIEVQQNTVSAAVDSVVGTSGDPGFYQALSSAWTANAGVYKLIWTNFHWGLAIAATRESDRLVGDAQPITDFGSFEAYPFAADQVLCDEAPGTWYYVSGRGGRRTVRGSPGGPPRED